MGTAALGVTLALQVTQTLNWSVRQACEVEAHLISVERLRGYTALEPEPGWAPLPLQHGPHAAKHAAATGAAADGAAALAQQHETAPAPAVKGLGVNPLTRASCCCAT